MNKPIIDFMYEIYFDNVTFNKLYITHTSTAKHVH